MTVEQPERSTPMSAFEKPHDLAQRRLWAQTGRRWVANAKTGNHRILPVKQHDEPLLSGIGSIVTPSKLNPNISDVVPFTPHFTGFAA
jgi:hypothetical protein